ncbi:MULTISPECIES: helix-turn-helix domain-containing protein [Staphylococcus]|uniref:helix-turn-helix domain-containing protein n=1 Tax=Staphylococcus TaxID=1279 RepID=UPI0021A540CE|nr:helix-turn-helix transcriptional regulator [Staphylococcus epidermidis]MCT1513195.1 helix-turn-helix transcriptional regulator [Staphylococcus epidermidis]
MNLERMMDTMIGDRIKKFRKSQGLTQEAFCEKYENKVSIDKYRLSALENGRREKNKNPHFLTEEYKKLFSKLMNVDNKTFVFGNSEEKHQLIKLILLNILMNGTTSPSHRIKCLFGNFDFAYEFLSTVENLETFHLAGLLLRERRPNYYIDNYLRGDGSFGSKATDCKEMGYRIFITSFNEFYQQHAEVFFEFFEKNMFQSRYHAIINECINSIFQSDGFLNVLNEIHENDQYLSNRMLGHNFSRSMIQKLSLVEERSKRMAKQDINLDNKKIVNPTEYYDLENMTLLFVDKDKDDKSAGLFLPEYFNITPLE